MAPRILVMRRMPSRDWAMALGTSWRSQFQSGGGSAETMASEGPVESVEAGAEIMQALMAASSSLQVSRRNVMLSEIYWAGVLSSWAMPAASCPMAESFSVCRAMRRSLISRAEMTNAWI